VRGCIYIMKKKILPFFMLSHQPEILFENFHTILFFEISYTFSVQRSPNPFFDTVLQNIVARA
jgi:hypothetical protein